MVYRRQRFRFASAPHLMPAIGRSGYYAERIVNGWAYRLRRPNYTGLADATAVGRHYGYRLYFEQTRDLC